MALGLNRKQPRRRRTGVQMSSDNALQSYSSGWNAIQAHMLAHDEDMIGDFADDIDTLLVFAGLFSAILTAFVIASLIMLQPDNSGTSVQLLSLIAMRLGESPEQQPFVNASASSLPQTTTFYAAKSAVAINTLWFSGLVLSLAAALLGILAKQWCREYLKWYSVLSPARENVLLRQLRYEAWQQWHIPSIIGAIPALLEVALVFFYLGLAVFVYNLQHVVAAFTILLIGLCLSGAANLTVLPIYSPLCPFKSPTGWALLRGYHAARDRFSKLRRRIVLIVRRYAGKRNNPSYSTHPEFSMSSASGAGETSSVPLPEDIHHDPKVQSRKRLDAEGWRQREVRVLEHPKFELCGLAQCPADEGEHLYTRPDQNDMDYDSFQLQLLIRALTWVRRGSDEAHLSLNIAECMRSLHVKSVNTRGPKSPYFHTATHALRRAIGWSVDSTTMRNWLSSLCCETLASVHAELMGYVPLGFRAVQLPHCFGPYTPGVLHHGPPSLSPSQRAKSVRTVGVMDEVDVWIVRQLVFRDLLALIDDWAEACKWRNHVIQNSMTERVAYTLCLLRCMPAWVDTAAYPEENEQWASVLVEAYRKLVVVRIAHGIGLVSMVLELLCLIGQVTIDIEEHDVSVENVDLTERGKVRNCILFAVQIYEKSDGYTVEEARHLFVMATEAALRSIFARVHEDYNFGREVQDAAGELLPCMVQAMQISLENRYTNCGAFVNLPWLATLAKTFREARHWQIDLQNIPMYHNAEQRRDMHALLALLLDGLNTDVVVGDQCRTDFRLLMDMLGHPRLPDPRKVMAATRVSVDVKETPRDAVETGTVHFPTPAPAIRASPFLGRKLPTLPSTPQPAVISEPLGSPRLDLNLASVSVHADTIPSRYLSEPVGAQEITDFDNAFQYHPDPGSPSYGRGSHVLPGPYDAYA